MSFSSYKLSDLFYKTKFMERYCAKDKNSHLFIMNVKLSKFVFRI